MAEASIKEQILELHRRAVRLEQSYNELHLDTISYVRYAGREFQARRVKTLATELTDSTAELVQTINNQPIGNIESPSTSTNPIPSPSPDAAKMLLESNTKRRDIEDVASGKGTARQMVHVGIYLFIAWLLDSGQEFSSFAKSIVHVASNTVLANRLRLSGVQSRRNPMLTAESLHTIRALVSFDFNAICAGISYQGPADSPMHRSEKTSIRSSLRQPQNTRVNWVSASKVPELEDGTSSVRSFEEENGYIPTKLVCVASDENEKTLGLDKLPDGDLAASMDVEDDNSQPAGHYPSIRRRKQLTSQGLRTGRLTASLPSPAYTSSRISKVSTSSRETRNAGRSSR